MFMGGTKVLLVSPVSLYEAIEHEQSLLVGVSYPSIMCVCR